MLTFCQARKTCLDDRSLQIYILFREETVLRIRCWPHFGTDPNPDLYIWLTDPDPAIFVRDLQEGNSKLFFSSFFAYYFLSYICTIFLR